MCVTACVKRTCTTYLNRLQLIPTRSKRSIGEFTWYNATIWLQNRTRPAIYFSQLIITMNNRAWGKCRIHSSVLQWSGYADSWESACGGEKKANRCVYMRRAVNYGLSKCMKAPIRHITSYLPKTIMHTSCERVEEDVEMEEKMKTKRNYSRRLPILPLTLFKWIDQMTRTWK